jgi:hypothetical protein
MPVAVRSPIAALTIAAAFVLAAATFSGPAFAQAKQQSVPAKQDPAKQAPAKEDAPAEAKQMALTDKQIESVLAAQTDFDALGSQQPPDKPGAKGAPNMVGKLDDVAKKHGFTSYADYAIVLNNIELVMNGFDPKTKTYVGPEAVLKQQIAEIQADKKIPAAEKKEALADLNQALKTPPPAVEFKANIELVGKYYDKLSAMMQEDE